MKTITWSVTYGLLIGLLAVGVLQLVAKPARGNPVELLPPPTLPPLVVHVSGAVNQPGVYSLSPGSRVQDAIQAAGGFSLEADQERINLARFLEDGERLDVPLVSVAVDPSTRLAENAAIPPSPLVNINTGTQQELETLPEIGPSTAQKIIAFREQNGPFMKIEDILDVPGIGPGTFQAIKDLITVGEGP